jgi:predicted MFS family arabinose efflux permease
MNSGSTLAAIVSPLIASYVIDVTGDRLPFTMARGLRALGACTAFLMHPERQLTDEPKTVLAEPVKV